MERSAGIQVPHGRGAEPIGEPQCDACGSASVERGYQTHLCSDCRRRFSQRPFPVWIRVTSVGVLVAVVAAIVLSRTSLMMSIAFERGRRAEKQRQFADAAREYQKVVDQFPQSTLAVGRLGIAYARSNQPVLAIEQFEKLRGRDVDPQLADELKSARRRLEARAAGGVPQP